MTGAPELSALFADLIDRLIRGDVPAPPQAALNALAAARDHCREATQRLGVPVLTAFSHLVAERAGVLDIPEARLSDLDRNARRGEVDHVLVGLLGYRPLHDQIARVACGVFLEIREELERQGLDPDREDHGLAVLFWVYRVLLRAWCSSTPVLLARCLLGSHVDAVDAVESAIEVVKPGGPSLVHELQRAARTTWMREVRYEPAAEQLIAEAASLLGQEGAPPVDGRKARSVLRTTLARAQEETLAPPDPSSDSPRSRAWRHAHLGLLADLIGNGPRGNVRIRDLLDHWRARAALDARHFVHRDDGGRSLADRVVEGEGRRREGDPALAVEAAEILACLDDRERRALHMFFVEEASYVLVGADLGMSDVGARKFIGRTVRKLKRRNRSLD